MKLLTEKIIEDFKKYPFGSQDNKKGMERKVLVKFFNPYGVGTWIITEAEWQEETKDWLLYGLGDLGYGYEWGYVSFNELNALRVPPFHMPIERDMYIGNCKVKDLVKESELM